MDETEEKTNGDLPMKPTHEEMLEGACKWVKKHNGVTYELSFHGYRRDSESVFGIHEGTWCYYIYVPQEMYPHRFDDFAVTYEGGYGRHGPAWEQVTFDTEITWASSERGYDRKTNIMKETSKVGCDYNHSWHRDMGYPDNYISVNLDAIRTVESLLETHPDYHLRCNWSGLWGPKEDFYECVGGWMVHKDSEIPKDYDNWKRKPDGTTNT